MSGAYYKGQPLDLERFRQLVLGQHPEYAQRPLSVKQVWRLGLHHPLEILAKHYGSAERVIEEAGFTTYRKANPCATPSERELRERLMDYHQNPTSKPINLHKMQHDVEGGGAQLATALGRFAKKHVPPYTRTAANTIRYFGFKTSRTNNTADDITKKLQKVWPKEKVEAVYAGDGTLDVPVTALKTINPMLYGAMHKRGIAQVVNAVHPGYPDLYWYVRSSQSPITPADPDSVRKQLLDRFYAGRSIGHGLRKSSDPNDRILFHRVLSLAPSMFKTTTKPYSQIVHELLPELSMDDINGNSPAAIYNTGRIGNLFVEWLLKWTMAMDPYGAFYRDGFKDIFTAPLRQVFAEKRLAGEDGRLVPDLLVVGRQNTGIEVRTGEHPRNAVSLAKKYGDGDYQWNIDGESYPLERTVAVLHMPIRAVRKAAPQLTDAGFTIVDSERFLNYLELFIRCLEQSPWHEQFAAAAPRVHNAQSLVSLYKQLAFYPATLTRPANSEAVAFAKQTLEELATFEPAA